MSYCKKCGTKLADGARYCQKCGLAVNNTSCSDANKRDYEYEGKVYKCPNCGEVLKSFMRNCPACGFELRNVKATNAVKEFAMKLVENMKVVLLDIVNQGFLKQMNRKLI